MKRITGTSSVPSRPVEVLDLRDLFLRPPRPAASAPVELLVGRADDRHPLLPGGRAGAAGRAPEAGAVPRVAARAGEPPGGAGVGPPRHQAVAAPLPQHPLAQRSL